LRTQRIPSGASPRLVEQRHLRVAEQCRGDAEPLAHAEGELSRALARDRGEPDYREHLVDSPERNVVRFSEHPQVRAGAATWVDRLCLQ
jgi:hypothetical protein